MSEGMTGFWNKFGTSGVQQENYAPTNAEDRFVGLRKSTPS